jgi:hypothetical protein
MINAKKRGLYNKATITIRGAAMLLLLHRQIRVPWRSAHLIGSWTDDSWEEAQETAGLGEEEARLSENRYANKKMGKLVMLRLTIFVASFWKGKGKDKGNVHPRTGHDGPEGE